MKVVNKLLFILIAALLVLSVLGCSYLASTSMVMSSHEQMVLIDHIDHANSLVLAIVPIMAALIFFMCVLIFMGYLEIPGNVLFRQSFINKSPPIVTLESFRYLFNPRSPPVI
jgi:hypothetical protein